ncbi:hypothetical protein D5086_018684 [Populus alba]|uniref:Uncharacterized protein n=1 Tax=Populus alba TaxID=43335 RepID=A0ACC4BQR0_POPAL
MKKFSQPRKSRRTVVTVVHSSQVPLYGGMPPLADAREHANKVAVPLNLTFSLRSRAYILGRLVKSKFYNRVRCTVTLTGFEKKIGVGPFCALDSFAVFFDQTMVVGWGLLLSSTFCLGPTSRTGDGGLV